MKVWCNSICCSAFNGSDEISSYLKHEVLNWTVGGSCVETPMRQGFEHNSRKGVGLGVVLWQCLGSGCSIMVQRCCSSASLTLF